MKTQKLVAFSCTLLCLQIFHSVNPAHILFYHQIASYSHQVATYPLAEALLERGHQITYITPWYQKDSRRLHPNITHLVPEKLRKTISDFAEFDFDIKYRVEKLFPRIVYQFYPTAITTCRDLLSGPELEKWTKETTTLDLIIFDNCMSECGMAIARKYGSKHIYFSTISHLGNEYDQFGFNPESSAIPETEIDPPQVPMNFMERVLNTLISIHFRWVHYSYLHDINELVRNYLDEPSMPFIDDLARNFSLVFYTGDIITDHARSHPPSIVNIGGMHCHQPNKAAGLSSEIQAFIKDPSSDGFIYISFGSVALASKLPESLKQVFFDTIKEFPKLKFLWKWNGPIPENVPKNLYLSQWFPQVDLLAHPKIKGFVTQSGRPSMLEATCNAVPMIAFPVLGDQDINANRMNQIDGNVKLELAQVTREELKDAIQNLVYDPRMKKRMLHFRDILNDQPMPPLEKAVWWTEYVLRHKDTSHLRPAGFDQWWFQRRLIDVWAFLFLIIVVILASIFLIFSYCVKRLVVKSKPKQE